MVDIHLPWRVSCFLKMAKIDSFVPDDLSVTADCLLLFIHKLKKYKTIMQTLPYYNEHCLPKPAQAVPLLIVGRLK